MEDEARKPFIIIVFTAPEPIEGEARLITRMLREGASDIVHIRKPDASAEELRALLEAIPRDLHSQLRLHSHFQLCSEYPVGGIHLNRRFPVAPAGYTHLSRSCHSLEELPAGLSPYDYVTLSPIFDSISKPGYSASFTPEDCSEAAARTRIVALGGVRPEHLPRLRAAGFYGAALMGAIWNAPDGADAAIDGLIQAGKEIEKDNVNSNQ